MQKLVSVFSALDPARRVLVLVATAGAFLAVLAIARMANAPTMALLYSGLEPTAAGEVIQSLDQIGATYEVREGAIFVDARRRDRLRMALAAEGKPASTTAGYEILDGLTGFGTTSQMFDAAYWRAKEGELARTILASPLIRSARVHISNPRTRGFGARAPGAASVVISTADSGLSGRHAKALKFLVASAVAGLSPDEVSVIDVETGLVSSGDGIEDPTLAAGNRAATLKANVERLLEAHVGHGNTIVEVNIETVNEREQIVERRFDPDSRVAISTVTEETTSSAQDTRNGQVTVAGNLPDGDQGGSGANSASQNNETREQVNYEVSETQREVLRTPGAIRRLSVAVLVNGVRDISPDGSETWQPRSEEEIAALRDLVKSAVGFQEERGDVITLRSMEFSAISPAGTEAVPLSLLDRMLVHSMQLIQLGALAVVSLILGLFVVRPILLARPRPEARVALTPPATSAPSDTEPPVAVAQPEPLTGEVEDGPFLPKMTLIDDSSGNLPANPVDGNLQRLIDGRQDETATVLRDWMEDEAEIA